MELDDAADFLATQRFAALAVPRPDGHPHVSRVVQVFASGRSRISVTEDRVKTGLLRDAGAASLHVRGDDECHWVTIECDVDVGPVAAEPTDAVVDELLEIYEAVQGEHPDHDEFRRAMVSERRLVLRCVPTRVYGQL